MFSKIKTMKFTESYLNNLKKLKEEFITADAILIGAGADFQHLPDLITVVKDLKNIFLTLKRNTALLICIPVDFMILIHLRNIGLGGQGTY